MASDNERTLSQICAPLGLLRTRAAEVAQTGDQTHADPLQAPYEELLRIVRRGCTQLSAQAWRVLAELVGELNHFFERPSSSGALSVSRLASDALIELAPRPQP